MSYNFEKVSGKEANDLANIEVGISNITSASNTPSVVGFDGSTWGNTTITSSDNKKLYYYFANIDSSWGSGINYSAGDYFVWRSAADSQTFVEYADSSVSSNQASTSKSPTSNAKWRMSLSLTESGTYLYLITGVFGSSFLSGDSATLQLKTEGSVSFSSKVKLVGSDQGASSIFGVVTLASSDVLYAEVLEESGADALEGGNARFFNIQLYKLN